MRKIQPIRQTMRVKDLPVFLGESPQDSPHAMQSWLLKHSGACWKDVRWLEIFSLPALLAFEFVGYFEE